MFLKAQQELSLDLENSFLIGNKASDTQKRMTSGFFRKILLADIPTVELHDAIYSRLTSLADTLHFFVCGRSTVVAQ
jgi:histidinol phosphatase-like enzyme